MLELKRAVEFTAEYGLDCDPFAAAVWELTRGARGCARPPHRAEQLRRRGNPLRRSCSNGRGRPPWERPQAVGAMRV